MGYPVFVGRRYQRGHVLGSIFGGLFKAAMPLLEKGAKTLGREALKTGLNIAGGVVQGRNCKSAILIRKCHSMCSVAWSADVWSFFAWQVL
jgi:hypothetical protein